MGLLEVLTIVFVVLKLVGAISWSWWLVLLPELIAVGIYVLWIAFTAVFIGSTEKTIKKAMKKGIKKR